MLGSGAELCNKQASNVTLEKQIRAGARSGSQRFGTNTNHENTPSLIIPCMYSGDLLSASLCSTSEIHKAHSQSLIFFSAAVIFYFTNITQFFKHYFFDLLMHSSQHLEKQRWSPRKIGY